MLDLKSEELKPASNPSKEEMDTMNGAILDELIETMKPEKNGHSFSRRYMTGTVIGILIVMVLYAGIVLAFLARF